MQYRRQSNAIVGLIFAALLLAGCGSKPQFDNQHAYVFDIGTDENRPALRLPTPQKVATEYSGSYLINAHLKAGDYLLFAKDYSGGKYYRAAERVRLEYVEKGSGKFNSDLTVDGGVYMGANGEVQLYWFWDSGDKQPIRVKFPPISFEKVTVLDENLRRARLAREDDERKRADDERARATLLSDLALARTRNKVGCLGVQCDRLFALAQAYLLQQSDMRIQVATSTLIETYNGTSAGNLSMRIVRVPAAGETWEIILSVACKDEIQFPDICNPKLLRAYSGFLPHMSSR
jgi:hypothetical protein